MTIPTPKKSITKKGLEMETLQVFKVGGCVRDKLLDLPVADNDYVVIGSTPNEMAQLGFKAVGKDFPVFLHPQTREEYALARSEKKSGIGYRGFTFHTSPNISLIEDLERRDITINAIAEDKDGNLIDPFGGQTDLKNELIRHVSSAFIEDPLRVLRVARFAAKLNFTVARDTLDLMHKIALSGELQTLSKERIWQEVSKAMLTKHSINFFTTLHQVGALELILPEFVPLISNATALKTLKHITNRMHSAGYSLEQRFAILYYYVSTVHALAETEEYIKRAMVNYKCKALAYLIVRYYTGLYMFDSLSRNDVYKLITYLDPVRRMERYKSFTELVYMIASTVDDTKTRSHLEILKKIVYRFNKINPANLKIKYPEDFIQQIRKLKYEIIEQIFLEMSDC